MKIPTICESRLALFLFILVGSAILPLPGRCSGDSPIPTYDIEANLNVSEGTLQAKERLNYNNSTGVPLSSLVFNVPPAFYHAFQLKSARVAGKEARVESSGVVMEVFVPEPLAAGSSIDVDLDFILKVPRQEGRLGMGGGIISLGNWYPVLSAYSDGWDRHQYTEIGDAFFTAVANYNVSLRTSVPVNVAHTGNLIEHSGLERKIEAREVRDFALAVSDRYEIKSVVIDGVKINAYYQKGHEAGADVFLKAGAESLAWFGEKLGKYPYTNLDIAEIWSPGWLGTGQEYPSLILVGSNSVELGGSMGDYLSYLVVHEVAHQWFYGIVGNDQVNSPWLDEALATHISLLFFKDRYPSRYQELWKSRVTDGYTQYKTQKGDKKVNSTIYDFNDELYYFAMVYRKGALFLDELRTLLGDRVYLAALRKYVDKYHLGIANPRGFLDTIQNETVVDIKPLASRYFDYSWLSISPQPNLTATASAAPSQVTPTPFTTPSPTAPVNTPPVAPTPSATGEIRSIASGKSDTPSPIATPAQQPTETVEVRNTGAGLPDSPPMLAATLLSFILALAGLVYWRRGKAR